MPVPVLPNEGQQMPPTQTTPRARTPAEEAEIQRAQAEIQRAQRDPNKKAGKVVTGPDGKPLLGPDAAMRQVMDEAVLAGQVAGPPRGAQAGPAAQGGGGGGAQAPGAGVTNWAKKAKVGATFKDAKGNTWTMGANGPEMTSSGGKGGGKGGKRPIAEQASMQWANDVLSGDFESNPWIRNLMNPEALDVRNNPNLQAVANSIQNELQEDWLGNLRQLDAAAESRGRGGSPLAAALRARETEETQEAAANALNQLYAGAYENERNRQMQGLGMSLQAQAQAAGIPISWFEAQTGRQGVNVQRQLGREANQIDRGRLGLARQQFNFEREMALSNAQQDALNDYMNLISSVGGLGGTTTTPGQYVPTQSPWASAMLGGVGGYLSGKEAFD